MPFLGNIGTTELLIIAGIVLLFFGSKKLTELARGLGQSTKEIKKVKTELEKALVEGKEEWSSNEPVAQAKNKKENKTRGGE